MSLLSNNKTPSYSIAQQQCLAIPNRGSQASKWMAWHQSLKACFGRSGANALWMEAWDKYGRGTSNSTSTQLLTYMRSQGVDISQGAGESLSMFGSDVASFFGGYINFSKYVGMALAGGIAIGFLMLLYNIIMNPAKAKQSLGVITEGAMMATPQGRVASVATKSIGQ